ncbi:MAG: nucleotidyltransferase family protein [Burkholderiales bacterium]|nr:nucleotidyltransferase family protein [Burkholderiales bacterium]
MKPSDALQLHRDTIRSIVLRNGAENPRIFGSAARGEDTEASDLDLLVDPVKGKTTLLGLASIQVEVQDLTGIRTDVLTPLSLHERFRSQVLREAVPL